MQTAKVVKSFNNGSNVQLLCADDNGLLSVYFQHKPYASFIMALQKAGLKLDGLLIRFNRYVVSVQLWANKRLLHILTYSPTAKIC